ncbi:nad-dependent histone deacetylase hst3 [Fusarium albosuccineum]|uniref:Nad-dependent histone deacetylase hst3 n=1 Tax=Fusarium albosuccineum TaxID=1237068 RepID=A0A8H4LI03_9HYPO|nr:nad-dependent histone deacetylase hst3 [Fusarium albosuccineum]
MPTTHVRPDSKEDLQDIANGLLKARKVIVVTGAGISTNSGIPDFRSENGLYSLIQAQFDAAAQQARQVEVHSDSEAIEVDGRASKRRRLSCDDTPNFKDEAAEVKDEIEVQLDHSDPESEEIGDTIQVEGEPEELDEGSCGAADGLPLVNARTTRSTIAVAQPPTSPLSSPPPEDPNTLPSGFRRSRRGHLANVPIAPSSSPLSSPPPVLFDPFCSNTPSENGPSRRSSTSPSELDDVPPSNPISLSQASLGSGRNTLPNMKGKDLFDANIWADPLRTSVFYTFATTLRQKVKDVEPTSSHRFISHLRDRGKLVRCYTQNIDQIEEKVGLSTCLTDGPGSRGRFSRKSTANMNQLKQMVDETSNGSAESSSSEKPQQSSDNEASRSQSSQQSDGAVTPSQTEPSQSQPDASKTAAKNPRRELPKSGVECVFLHGSLQLLRCFLCGRVCSWEDDDRELETMSGQQPECPHCVGATTAREERGKRALGVGKLRPDIVLYGEEHPNAHLISPIITHDLALCPDLLLILGTSLRVHGLKVMVREFAKAVHAKGGKVVFVNFTKPPESSWGDIIDYWIEWDCDAWVSDLQDKVPKLWQAPEPPKPKKKRESSGLVEEGDKAETKRPPAAYPVALRDTKVTGAYWSMKIIKELHRITGNEPPKRRASLPAPVVSATATPETTETAANTITLAENTSSSTPSKPDRVRTRARRPRKSAPGALERSKKPPPSTLNPNHGRARRHANQAEPVEAIQPVEPVEPSNQFTTPPRPQPIESSILGAVKSNPRLRKRKRIDGVEVVMPSVGKRHKGQKVAEPTEAPPTEPEGPIQLPPLKPQPPSPITSPFGRPTPMEPRFHQPYGAQNNCSERGRLQSISPVSPPAVPLSSISINTRRSMHFTRSFAKDNPSSWEAHSSTTILYRSQTEMQFKIDRTPDEQDAALVLATLGNAPPRPMPANEPIMRATRSMRTRSLTRTTEGVEGGSQS